MPTEVLKLFGKYDLIGLIFGAVFILLFFIIGWVLKNQKDIIKEHNRERTKWFKVLDKLNDSITKHDKSSTLAHRAARKEHKEMIVSLSRINGFKK
jgi:hypothetical protein